MADVKHTQWAVFGTPQDPDFACEITSANGEIAAVYEHPNAEARGRLIASAPALLDALVAAETVLRYLPDINTNWGGKRETMTTRRAEALVIAAIAKATGAARATEGSATDAAECTCAAKDMPFGRCCKAGAA